MSSTHTNGEDAWAGGGHAAFARSSVRKSLNSVLDAWTSMVNLYLKRKTGGGEGRRLTHLLLALVF